MATSKIRSNKDLLWTNPSPTSAFEGRTISLDLSSYENIEIEMAGSASSANSTTQVFKMVVGIGGILSIAANTIWWRYVTPRANGVEFGGGYETTTYGSGATANNGMMVPQKIYGIKSGGVVSRLLKALKTLSFRKERGWA